MSGYGYYEEEEGQGLNTGGLMTGAGAKTRYKYVYSRVASERTGRMYPKRGPMTLEYASKLVFNSNLTKSNRWLDFIKNNRELKEKRAELAALMRKLSEAYKQSLTPEQREKLEKRKKPRPKSERLAEAKERIAQFKAKYPDPMSALSVLRNYLPDIRSARIFLRAVYGLSKDKALELLPKKRRLKFKPVSFGEYTAPPPKPAPPPPKPEEEVAKEEIVKAPPKEEEVEKPKKVVRKKRTEED
jgi:hypothetical protein